MTTTEAPAAESTETEAPAATRHPLLDKEPTHLHRNYAVWLKEKTGHGPNAPLDGEEPSQAWTDFVKTIQIAVVQYQVYQKSDDNVQRREAERIEKSQAAERAKAEREKAAAAKAAEKAKAKEEADAAKAASAAKASTATEGEDGPGAVKTRKAPAKGATKGAATVEPPF